MKYIDAVEGALYSFVVFLFAVIFIPIIKPLDHIDIILTISTFLFAILAGFFISRLGSRYDQIRILVSTEDANFLSLYKNSQLYGEEFAGKMRDLIDEYYISAYDFSLSSYSYKQNAKYFIKMWDEVIKNKKYRGESVFQGIATSLSAIEISRNSASTISKEKLNAGHWVILFFLTAIILFSIFCLRGNDLYYQIITVMFSTVLIMVLLIIRDLQNLMLGDQSLLEESGQEVLEFIGKPRYYNKYFIDRDISKIPNSVKEYRLGLHKPGSEEKNIKLIKR